MSNSHRIAHNSLMLYLRLLLSMVVGLYTSRVVLHTLGVEDYGIYSVVGGIVTIMGFLNVSMSNATSRFITYDLGIGDSNILSNTFNAAFQSHLIIAFIVVFFVETVGLWIISHHLVIPFERQHVVFWVFQISVFSAVIDILQSPFLATIIAHEQMNIYAWLELLSVALRLFVVWIIQVVSFDQMLTYAVLTLIANSFCICCYLFYCQKNYPESHLHWVWNPQSLRNMSTFMGWNLFSEGGDSFRQQGVNILLNRFIGVVANAASSIALMVQGAFWAIGHYTLVAFTPQIIQSYAKGDYSKMQRLMDFALKSIWILMSLITIPVFVELPSLLRIWLGTVPNHTISFLRILLIDNLLGLTNKVISQGLYSQGNIRSVCLVNGLVKLLCIPAVFLLLYFSFDAAWAYLTNIIALSFLITFDLYILAKQIPQLKVKNLLISLFRIATVVLVTFIPYIYLHAYCSFSILGSLSLALFFSFLLLLLSYYLLFDCATRTVVVRNLLCLLK